jgi:hypothetical protein
MFSTICTRSGTTTILPSRSSSHAGSLLVIIRPDLRASACFWPHTADMRSNFVRLSLLPRESSIMAIINYTISASSPKTISTGFN